MKINLRAIEPSDIDLIYLWENDVDVWTTSNTFAPFSRHILEQYILSAQNLDVYTSKQLRLMIDVCEPGETKTIGIIDLFDFEPAHSRAGVGILIDIHYRKKGYAYAALQKFIEYSFFVLHLHQLYCNIMATNEASLRLFKSLGFEIIGLKKDWIRVNDLWDDEYMFQLIKK